MNKETKLSLAERLKRWSKKAKIEIVALLLAYQHHDTPWYAKVVAALVVAYALSPVDLIPDFIPILGLLDDALLLPIGVALAVRLIPPAVLDECRRQARDRLDERPSSRFVAASLIILFWLSIAGALALLLFR